MTEEQWSRDTALPEAESGDPESETRVNGPEGTIDEVAERDAEETGLSEEGREDRNAQKKADTAGGDRPEEECAGREGNPDERGKEAVVRAKFNKRLREFTAEEAAPLVEQGLKFEVFRPQYEKLRRAARAMRTDVPRLIERMAEISDEALRQQAIEACGGNEEAGQELYALRTAESERAAERAKEMHAARIEQERLREDAERKAAQEQRKISLEQRLADGYLELCREFPGRFPRFEDVPEPAVRLAAEQGLPLLDAYLRVRLQEERRAERAREQQRSAAVRGVGTMADAGGDDEYSLHAFEKAFRRSLRS